MSKPDELHDVAAFDLGTADADVQADWVVYKDSVLFKPGDYKSHDFSMSPDEMKAAAAKVSGPIPNELEHVNSSGTATIIDDELGDVSDIRLSDDGSELKGTVKIPRWLDRVWDKHLAKAGGSHKQVSCVWDRRDKTLLKLGLVVKGRVPGAALMAAFSAAHPDRASALFAGHKTYHGQSTLQSIHDTSAACGAMCKKVDLAVMAEASAYGFCPTCGAPGYSRERRPNGNDTCQNGHKYPSKDALDRPNATNFHAAPELAAIQAVHDEAVKGGAACRFMDDDAPRMFAERIRHPDKTASMQAVHNVVAMHPGICPVLEPPTAEGMEPGMFADTTEQFKGLRRIHSIATEHGAGCPGARAAKMSETPLQTGIAGRVPVKHETEIRLAMFGAKADAAPPLQLTDEQADKILEILRPHADFADNPVAKKMAAEIDELKKAREADRKAAAARDAARFAEALAKEGRIDPVHKAAVASLALRLTDDDHATPATVDFSDKDGKAVQGARVDALFALFASMPARSNERPRIRDDGSLEDRWKAHFNSGHAAPKKDGDMTPEDQDAFLMGYPGGPGLVADRKKARAR